MCHVATVGGRQEQREVGTLLEEARELVSLGFNPTPCRRGKKSPGVPSWQQYRKQSTKDRIEAWFGPGSSYVGIWVVCGEISCLIVLDCDSPEAESYWRSIAGDWMDTTTCVKTQKGHHYWGMLVPGTDPPSWSVNEGTMKFDVKAAGGGVMAPPSPHPEGGYYEWVRRPEEIQPAPAILLDGGAAVRAALASGDKSQLVSVGWASNGGAPPATLPESFEVPRSLLANLLQNPPQEGGRNDWLIRVSGHLAKIVPYEDAYYALVNLANESLSDPLGDEEVETTGNSAWKAEKAKGFGTLEILQERGIVSGEPDDSNGWLIGTGNTLLTVALQGSGDMKSEVAVPWADFDITVLGSLIGDEEVDYLVRMTTAYREIECRLNSRVLGSPKELTVWLAERQGSIMSPTGDMHAKHSEGRRLQRYVQSQKAPVFKTVPSLGWHDNVGGFITHDGIIRAGDTQAHPFDDVRPSPILTEWAPYRYGFAGTREDARRVLREVLTYHDPVVTAVFGSWWAACYLKVQIMAQASLFPFQALEAPSESGKTTGFFSLMVQLGGNYEGHGEFTMAALRDRVSGHRNGITWMDDITDTEPALDIVRQSTSEGSRTKKQADRHHQERISLVSPIVLSAEGMAALNSEKALADRAIKLTVPSPTGRMSLKDSTRPQWDDILDLMSQFQGDMTQIAGWFVSMALECLPMVDTLRELRPVSGRHGDKIGILRLGARILAYMSGEDSVIDIVDNWDGSGTTYFKGDNILTTEILPWILLTERMPHTSTYGAPAYIDRHTGCVWYNEQKVAEAWGDRRNLSPRQRQLGSIDSLRGQRRDLGLPGSGTTKSVSADGSVKLRYHMLNEEMSIIVRERAGEGKSDDELL